MNSEVIKSDTGTDTDVVTIPNGNQQLSDISPEDLMAKIEMAQNADIESAPEAGINYWEVEEGKEMRGVFRGFKPHTLKDGDRAGEVIPCPVIQVSRYQAFISMAIVLVEAFKTIPVNTAVYVRCDSAKKGQTAQFTVKVLGE